MWSALKVLFGFTGVADTALKVVERVTGVDDNPAEKRKFLLDWMEATKHQSPMRRIIAAAITFVWVLMVLVWLVMLILSNFLNPDLGTSADLTRMGLEKFMAENITQPLNIVVGFYFAMNMLNGFKK